MNAAAAIIIVLSHQGHWFGGHDNWIDVQWQPQANHPQAVLVWDLRYANASLASGKVDLPKPNANNQPTRIRITVPHVRHFVELQWRWQLVNPTDGNIIDSGMQLLHIYPDNLLADVAASLDETRLYLIDNADGLPAVFATSAINQWRFDTVSQLAIVNDGLAIVGVGKLQASPLVQSHVVRLAESGTDVLVLTQNHLETIAGLKVSIRSTKDGLMWRSSESLFGTVNPQLADQWYDDLSVPLYPVQISQYEDAFRLAWWQPDASGDDSFIDALIVVRRVGKGTIVYCQWPVDTLQSDPRSQILLAHLLNYMIEAQSLARSVATTPATTLSNHTTFRGAHPAPAITGASP